MKFEPVDPDEIDNTVATHRGRVSYPIIKTFLESGLYIGKLDKTGINRSNQSLMAGISGYVRRHGIPIKLFSRNGIIYFMRLDVDKNGNQIPDWEARLEAELANRGPAMDLTPELVAQQLKEG